jgi:hypothetical protein
MSMSGRPGQHTKISNGPLTTGYDVPEEIVSEEMADRRRKVTLG